MKKSILFVIVFCLDLALGASGCSLSLAPDITPPPGYQLPAFQETLEPAVVSPLEAAQSPAVESTREPSVDGEEVVSTQEVAGDETAEVPAGGGTVYGTVENGSGGGLPEGLGVTFYGYDQFEEVIKLTTQVGENGRFVFEGVNLTENFIYFTLVDYRDTTYGSEFHIAGPDETDVDLSVVIYDTTTDPSNLVVDRLHVFFTYPTPEVVRVIHSLTISNLGNEAVIPSGEAEATVEFILPEGATNLIFEQGEIGQPYIATTNGFGDTAPIVPGTGVYQLLYAYELPYNRQMEWVQPFTLPTDVVVLFVPEGGLKVESEQLTASGSEILNDVVYRVYVGGEMVAGDVLQVEISGRNPSAGSGLALSADTTSLVVGALGLALTTVGVWWWFRTGQDSGRLTDRSETPESIMDEIIALDEAYEAGQIEEAVYQAKRTQLKAHLRELVEKTK
jgi:hypothetical protein